MASIQSSPPPHSYILLTDTGDSWYPRGRLVELKSDGMYVNGKQIVNVTVIIASLLLCVGVLMSIQVSVGDVKVMLTHCKQHSETVT